MNDYLLVVTNKGKLMTVITIGCVPAAATVAVPTAAVTAAVGTTPNKLYNVLHMYIMYVR